MPTNKVTYSTFYNFAGSQYGSVFNILSFNCEVYCCHFEENSASISAGSIYLKDGSLKISKTSFKACYSTKHENEFYGNAVYIEGNPFTFEDTSTYLCGKTDTLSTDSSIAAKGAKTTVKNYNATTNYGIWGASAINIMSCQENTKVKYIQSIDGRDAHSVEVRSNKYCINNSNFINCTGHSNLLWESANNLMTFDSCIFWNVGNVISQNSVEFIAINCVTNNNAITAMTYSSILNTNKVEVKLNCKRRTCKIYKRNNNIINILIFVILS